MPDDRLSIVGHLESVGLRFESGDEVLAAERVEQPRDSPSAEIEEERNQEGGKDGDEDVEYERRDLREPVGRAQGIGLPLLGARAHKSPTRHDPPAHDLNPA
jgi:hypothetical protein